MEESIHSDIKVSVYSIDTDSQPIIDRHPGECELNYIMKGSRQMSLEDTEVSLSTGDLIYIPENMLHGARILDGDNRCAVIHFKGGCIANNQLYSNFFKDKPLIFKLTGELRGRIERLISEMHSENYESCAGCGIVIESELNLILVHLLRHDDMLVTSERYRLLSSSDYLPGVIDYIESHLCEELSVDELCSRFYIHPVTLSRNFKRYTGQSVYKYILSKRIALAKRLLCEYRVSDVYKLCGFNNIANFERIFRNETGYTPYKYKKEFLKDDILL